MRVSIKINERTVGQHYLVLRFSMNTGKFFCGIIDENEDEFETAEYTLVKDAISAGFELLSVSLNGDD